MPDRYTWKCQQCPERRYTDNGAESHEEQTGHSMWLEWTPLKDQ